MFQSMLERPALSMSGLGLLIVGLMLTGIGFAISGAAFTAGGLAFLGVLILLSTGVGCLTVSLIALLGRPRSMLGRVVWVAAGWVAAAYPLSLALTYFGIAYMAALPIAIAGIALAWVPIGKSGVQH